MNQEAATVRLKNEAKLDANEIGPSASLLRRFSVMVRSWYFQKAPVFAF